jgi:sugar diacid utilization regulator/putative methionine-R-sulfoxide reductase with GAF domain
MDVVVHALTPRQGRMSEPTFEGGGSRLAVAGPTRIERRRVRWPRVIADMAMTATEGSHAVAAAGVRAARPLLACDAAAVVRWQDGRPVVLAADGHVDGLDLQGLIARRPPEGAGWADGRPVAAVSVDPRTDVVVARSALIAFGETDQEALRALGELINWAGGGRQPDALLRGFATRVVASLEPDEVLVSTADAVAQLLRAEIAGVLLCDAAGDLEMRCAIGNTRLDTARLRIRAGQGLAGRVVQSGRPERIDDYSTDPRSAPEFMALSDIEGTCSAIAVPLRWDGRITGALCGWRRRREPFTEEDESLFAAFAQLCGAAIHNADRHEAECARARRSEAEHAALLERHRGAERDLHVYAELTRTAMEGGDVAAVVRVVGRLTRGLAVVVAEDGRVLGPSPAKDVGPVVEGVLRAPSASLDDQASVAVAQPDGSWLLVAHVRAAGVTFGNLALALPSAPTGGDRLAAEHAAVVCALLLAREEAAVAAARRLQSEFVWDLLTGRLPDAVEAGVRARHLGTGFALPARVVAVMVHGLAYDATASGWNPEHLERTRSACARLIGKGLDAAEVSGAVLARRANLFAAIVPVGTGTATVSVRRLAQALAALPWPDGMSAAIGIGGPVADISGFPDGWREARLARSAAGSTGEPGVFEDLGVLQFLLAPTSREDLDGFARRQLGPLLDYDQRRGTELTRTLEVYLAAGCSTRRTADLLCVHHRTVSYRLARITELTGLCLDDQEHRFRVQLACKILALARRGSATVDAEPGRPEG